MKKVLYILGQLEDTDMEWILGAGRKERVAAGEAIIQEGQESDRVFILVDGRLRVSIEALGGIELARFGQGDVAGEMSLLESDAPSATVTATEDSKVFSIPKSTLETKIQNDPAFGARFYRALCVFLVNRLTRTSEDVSDASSAGDAGTGPGAGAGSRRMSQVLDEQDLQWLRETGDSESVASGRVLIEEGQKLQRLFLVEQGQLQVTKGSFRANLDEGQVAGEMSLLYSPLTTASVVASQDTEVCAIPFRAIERRCERDQAFSARFHRAMGVVLAGRLGRTSRMVGKGNKITLNVDEREQDEISPDALDNVSLAGARFDWFLKELRRR